MFAPPLLVSFDNLKNLKKAFALHADDNFGYKFSELYEKGLPPIATYDLLATMFGYSRSFVISMAKDSDKYYREFKIRKGKKVRKIQAPKVALKIIQKWIGYHLAEHVTLHPSVFGFVPGKSFIDAAVVHCSSQWVYSIDIKDFFPTTSILKVKKAFQDLGYSSIGADLASRLCCYKGYLTQGSPASPVLSNLVFASLDKVIAAMAEKKGCRYTRYADDITISGKGAPLSDSFKEKVKSAITKAGWTVSLDKEHFSQLPNRLKVHGLLVHGEYPRLTKGYRNKIRTYRHLLDNDKVNESDLHKFRGHVSYEDSILKYDRS